METKRFQEYLQKRLAQHEIEEFKVQAELELNILSSMRRSVAQALEDYMQAHNLGLDEIGKYLGMSAAHVTKIRRGEANLTLASLAHIFALIGKPPHDVFGNKK